MELECVDVIKDTEMNVILGQSHFIKTVEDIYEVLVSSVPGIKFGVAFCEASGDRLVRYDGTDERCTELAIENARSINAGHFFIIVLDGTFPINVLPRVKQVQEVCGIYCATANPVQVIVAVNSGGRGVLGVIDGSPTLGIEGEKDRAWRKQFLRDIGYKR